MSGQETLLIELHYLPCIQYFVYLSSFENVIIDIGESYKKQTYRNRCCINGANKIEDLIIPVRKIHGIKTKMRDVEIDYSQKWLGKHLRAIQSAYGKAPFYEFYIDDFRQIYNKKPWSLFDLNKALLTKCLELMQLEVQVEFLARKEALEENSLHDARNAINPKRKELMNALFSSSSYFQVFGKNFVDNLSIIDLIFCEGPRAREVIIRSCRRERQI